MDVQVPAITNTSLLSDLVLVHKVLDTFKNPVMLYTASDDLSRLYITVASIPSIDL